MTHIFKRLEKGLTGIDFLNITDSALARMKLAPLPFASLLKQRFGLEPLVNLSCRDRNVIAIQGDLLAAWVTGIRSIVALTGDAVTIGDSPEAKGVFEINSIGLLNMIAKLNSGSDLAGNELRGAPAFIPGVVVNPNARNVAAELKRLKRKTDAGARYALSQPVFDKDTSYEFFKQARQVGLPIFMGLLPIKVARSIEGVSKVPGIKVSQEILSLSAKPPDHDVSQFFLNHCLELAKLNREHVCGFHVISGATPSLALELAGALASYIKEIPV